MSDAEVAVVDVREARFYAQGHINLSAHFALSSLEYQVLRAIPNKHVSLIVVDDAGAVGGAAERAVSVLTELSFTHIRVLDGGIKAWQVSGYSLGTGYNTLVKAFADLAHAHYATPTLTPEHLQARFERGQATTLIDCRPEHEYQKTTVGRAFNVPGVELALHNLNRTDEADHLYVISCFSRTRGIVAATTLALLDGVSNVAFLEDGVMASFLYGLPTGPGDNGLPAPGQFKPGGILREQAETLVRRHGLSVIDYAHLQRLIEEQDDRTLYVFDVRPEADYRAGHLAQAVSVPGGQLLMTYDAHVPVRNARVVLVDDGHLKRAAVSAFWLSHFNNAEIHLLALDEPGVMQVTETAADVLPDTVQWLAPQAVQQHLDAGYAVLDVGPSLDYELGHLPGAKFVLRPSLAAWLETRSPGPLVFTSPDGVNAAYAAAQVSRDFGVEAYALKGGTQAWRAAGLPLEVEFAPQQLLSPFDDDWGSTMRAKENREQIFRDYLSWERSLGHDIAHDQTVQFRWPETATDTELQGR
ncbi:rhodanese-like domain-containing protein [Pseudomonas sp. 7P_10.2_Bac1]|uniref:rhodanese-like domain-containing protein n=1 Tax=Pseudomonas sp. 7P_10.2_Bac1 TaxID=2971614 RepID=UPI0021CA40A2|nr:rhodanese-like domain-containing protein [Pseudomonas sp. 7P_10.2_Bac1]MCU1726334.1 rhodanese-like domain-containing protein [Pseudomonas sp. 7P_10.2_Bac1]